MSNLFWAAGGAIAGYFLGKRQAAKGDEGEEDLLWYIEHEVKDLIGSAQLYQESARELFEEGDVDAAADMIDKADWDITTARDKAKRAGFTDLLDEIRPVFSAIRADWKEIMSEVEEEEDEEE